MKRTMLYLSVLVLTCGLAGPAKALIIGTFTWSGVAIVGEDPGFLPAGNAVFDVSGSLLTITLTNTSPQTLQAIGEALSILTWDITDPGVSLTPLDAMIASGSGLVGGVNVIVPSGVTDLSGEWAFKSDISAGSSLLGPLGSFGIGAVGDINFGLDTFGGPNLFDPAGNVFGQVSPDGIDASIVGPNVNLTLDGFPNQGPLVQNQMVFQFFINTGTLEASEITNVQPLFGTDGATLVPEPTTIVLLGLGLICMFCITRFRRPA